MTDTIQTDTATNTDDRSIPDSVTDPESIADEEELEIHQRTYAHENPDHCEADAIGRAIVGVTDESGRLLLLINPEADHAVLPNDTVAPGEDWATVGQHWVEGMVGVDITLDAVERVRRVDHVIDGESTPHSITHHIVFSASVTSPEATLDELCEDNDWELGWYDDLPVEVDDGPALDDVQLLLG